MDLWVIFLTGLTVGGLTCLAVQGGLLAGTIAAHEEEKLSDVHHKRHVLWPTLAFLTTKLIAYIILGFALGTLGGYFAFSDTTRIIMQLVAGLYMIAVALELLRVHPIFKYVIIQPPKFLYKMVKSKSNSQEVFAPALLGAMTIFIPCGTTLAMETLAISTGNGLLGALIMATFTLGTIPLFLGLGVATSTLGHNFRAKFAKVAAAFLIYLGATSINGVLNILGSPISFQTLAAALPIEINLTGDSGSSSTAGIALINGVQVVDVSVFPTSYSPNRIQVKMGVPVKMNLTATGGTGCTSFFRIPQLSIVKKLSQGVTESVEFTPKSAGKLSWTCSMGMYNGVIEVI